MLYHLVVSSDPAAWTGNHFEMSLDRCLEYTDRQIQDYFFRFGETRIDELLGYPAILAHESCVSGGVVKLARLREITKRRGAIRVQFDYVDAPFLTRDQFLAHKFDLDIDDFEYNRTHWSIKRVDLPEVLSRMGISTPVGAFPRRPYVDLETFRFTVALSFPGEDRDLVEDIASRLEQRLGPNSCFYDFHYKAYLARPSLDTLLQTVYRNARLNVVFLSANYERKLWCSGVEFRAIREIIAQRQHDRVMFVRTDDGAVNGVLSVDGWIDSREHSPDDIAFFIEQRSRVPNLGD